MALPTHLQLQIVSADKSLVNETVDEVEIPGADGYFGVLPGHTPLLAALGAGEMWYRRGTEVHHLVIALGFVWSFINPLLLLSIYSFVFTTILPNTDLRTKPYAVFMFCGLLPWTWFAASLTEATSSLITGGNLIKKVLFPAEVLPIVSVLANMVHFLLGLVILAAFMIGFQHYPNAAALPWFPVVVLIQLIFTLGLALGLAALTVHFRDIRDLLTTRLALWFFV